MKKPIALMLSAVMLLGMTSCSKDSGGSNNPGGASAAAKTDTTTLNLYLASEPNSIDPALNTTVDGCVLLVNSFEGLLTYDTDGSTIIPGCAESYTVSDDRLVYTFTMRDGLKWSNGETLDAKDFVYSWTRAADINTAADYGYLYEVLANGKYDADGNFIGLGDGAVTASEDGKTLTVTLASPCPYFLDLCAFPTFFPVYEPSVTAGNPDGTTPGGWAVDATDKYVSNGAYKLSSWDHDSGMTYVANENWRNADKVSIKTLNYMLSSDETATYAAYQSGNLDFIDSLPIDELGIMIKNNDPELYIVPQLGTNFVCFNYNSDLYSKLGLDEEQAKVFRHAMCLLIDRDYIVENITQAGQEPADTFVPSGTMNGSFKTKSYFPIDDYEANVAEAIELLKSIGFNFDENNKLTDNVSFNYLVNPSAGNIAIAEAIQSDFAAIGINMTIDQQEWNVYVDTRNNGNFDICRHAWIMDYDDPINMLEMWTTNSGNNDAQYGRDSSKSLDWAAYDKLISDIRSSTDDAARTEMMHQAEDMLMDTWCLLPIYYYNEQYVMRDYVKGVFDNVLGMKFFYYATIDLD